MPEPSLLDYLKALLSRQKLPAIPPLAEAGKSTVLQRQPGIKPVRSSNASAAGWPWMATASILLFALGQLLWVPDAPYVYVGIVLGAVAVYLALCSIAAGQWRMPEAHPAREGPAFFAFRPMLFILAILSFAMAFDLFAGNRFTFFNVILWLTSLVPLLLALWNFNTPAATLDADQQELQGSARKQWRGVLLVVFVLLAFFRFSQLSQVPPEMNSDHAEKLFDVNDILNGATPIFFERNTGREPLQFYLSAVIAKFTGTGISFTSLKLGTTLLGFLSLFYVYQLGKEFGGRWVGLFAAILAGVAYWPNVLARTGLRFVLYPAFVAPTLVHLIWALRGKGNNHYLLAGSFLGVGLLGYTAFRIMPLLIIVALLVYWLHTRSNYARRNALIGTLLIALVSLFVISPILRYALQPGSAINYRIATRLFTAESAYPGNPLLIFSTNLIKALIMPFYDGGNVWLIGLLHRPALDYLSAALLMAGVLLLVKRYRASRDWRDLFLLLSIPLLMLPSALSIAFPIENPALNRAGGAAVPIFVLCALALDALVHGIKDQIKAPFAPRIAQGSAIILLMVIASLNYDLAFHQYAQAYANFSWNSSELGAQAADFIAEEGRANVWVVAFPHWVDTRLVAIQAGMPGQDIGLWPEQLASTLPIEGDKLFLLNLQDTAGLDTLLVLYPRGELNGYESAIEGKDFFEYYVPTSLQ